MAPSSTSLRTAVALGCDRTQNFRFELGFVELDIRVSIADGGDGLLIF